MPKVQIPRLPLPSRHAGHRRAHLPGRFQPSSLRLVDWSWVDGASAAALGVAGIYFTWLSGKQGRTHALEMSDRQTAHAVEAARVAREQERKAEAYVHALEVAEQVGNWCQSVQPMLVTDPPQPLPPLPDLDAQVAARARLLAFGSAEVMRAWSHWEDSAKKILADDAYLSAMRAENAPEERRHRMKVQKELTLERKPAEVAARTALSDRVNLELTN